MPTIEGGDHPISTDAVPAAHPDPVPSLPWVWSEASRCALGILAVVVGLALMAGRTRTERPRGTAMVVRASASKVDPNAATVEALEGLPHIGPTLARRIVDARGDGPFRSAEDLRVRVRGIGPATLARIAPYLQFESRTAVPGTFDPTATVIVDTRSDRERPPSRSLKRSTRRTSVKLAAQDGSTAASLSP